MLRNSRITELVKSDAHLMAFLEKNFDRPAVSHVKREFLKRDLLVLKNSKLDLVHYASLIREIRERGGMELTGTTILFAQELEVTFGKHGFNK